MKYLLALCVCVLTTIPGYAAPIDSSNSQLRGSPVPQEPYSISQGACFTTMSQATDFTSNSNNVCGSASGNACYVQLTASVGSASTNNALRCPVGYDFLLAFGDNVINQTNPSQKLVYTPEDYRTDVSEGAYNYYLNNNYNCYNSGDFFYKIYTQNDGTQVDVGRGQIAGSPSKPAAARVGAWITNNSGIPVRVYDWTSGNAKCYTQSHVDAPNSSCYTINGAYWEVVYIVYAYPQQCKRNRGFYPYVESGPYNLPPASNIYSPTTVICGKSVAGWKQVGATAPNTCAEQ